MLESLLSAGTRLLGGFLGKSSQDEANQIARETAERNIALQKEYAQNAIQWKVADATKAGVHPLYALGASTTSFSPVAVGVSGANPLAESLQGMGQDLSRAAAVNRSSGGRVSAMGEASAALSLENQKLQNDYLRARIGQISQPGTPPGAPLVNAFPSAEVGTGEFTVSEKNSKLDERPPLMLGGRRIQTDASTSPMKTWQDQIGDEGPGNWIAQMAVLDTMMRRNLGSPSVWPAQAGRWAYETLKHEIFDELRNARRFGRKYLPSVIGN